MAILDAAREKDREDKKFLAALQGVDLESDDTGDIIDLDGLTASQEGFGIGMGLGYMSEV